MKKYSYVGPKSLLSPVYQTERQLIRSCADVILWIARTDTKSEDNEITATFIVDLNGGLWLADRRSEHIACARGAPVRAAGEITFSLAPNRAEVTAVTNQSTGFCPEPKCWPALANALDAAALRHPGHFTTAFEFRRCRSCGAINLVKDDRFECEMCLEILDPQWNFRPAILG